MPRSTNDHLCSFCNGILVRPHDEAERSHQFEERSEVDIANSIEAGCRLCTMLGEILNIRHISLLYARLKITPRLIALGEVMINRRHGTRGTEIGKYRRIEYVVSRIDGSQRQDINIDLVPTDDEPTMQRLAPSGIHQEFPLSLSTSSNSSFEFLREWSSFCRKHHEFCNEDRRPEAWLPTRLVDIGEADSQRPRVIVTANENIDCEYLCLSHRWIDNPLKLESTNIDKLKKEIPIEKISQTFRDAFVTTRQLGFRYLWVDSLCIMQDHQRKDGWKDWLIESALMGENYKHAALTIAPTPTSDMADEFFSNREVSQRTPLEVVIKRKAPEDMSWSMCQRPQVDVSGCYYCFSEDLWLSQVNRAPLNRRGWVYQERLLSPRTIHFATEVFWECRMKIASEMLPTGFPAFSHSAGTEFSRSTKCWTGSFPPIDKFIDKYGKWMVFVERFSHCRLTMDRDKLPAIAGVAAVVELPNDQYLAGLWRNGLASQLIWKRSRERLISYDPPSNYRAPSWSWASVNGPIEFPTSAFFIDRKSRYTAFITDCKVDLLVASHPFGQVLGGQLRLRADLARISPEQIAANSEWMLTLDDGNASTRAVTYYLCVFAAHISWCGDFFLLVLEPTTGAKSEEFRRIGLLFIRLGYNKAVEGFEMLPDRVITIV